MHVTYAPEDPKDGDRQEWDFEPGRIRSSAAEVIERRFGESFEMFVAGVRQGNMRARRVMLWHLMTRTHSTLRFEDTPDFIADEVRVEFSSKELTEIIDAMTKADGINAEKREAIIAAASRELAEAQAREAAGSSPGKATSKASVAVGG